MSNSALLAFLLVAGALTPGAALGQGAMELAIAGPQPHFVAAWAPKKEREAERSAVLAGRVSLELRDVSLDAALKTLTNQAGLRITYSRAVLPAGKRVTISARDVAVVTAMTEMLFRSGLDVVVDRDGALALVVCPHVLAETEARDSGAIVGTVTDKATGVPLVGASVTVGEGRWSAVTDSDGRYRIAGIEAGTYTLRARYVGYLPLSALINVTPSGDATLDFGLERSVQKLDELVTVTPGGIQTQVKALPTPVSIIVAQDIERRRPQAIQDVIRQAVPGAVAFHLAYQPTFTSMSVRGGSSLTGAGQMKVFIDGVEASAFSSSPVDPASIDRIEVIRGPQASTLYGADASVGVVQVFTKRGDAALTRPQGDLRAGLGVVQTPYAGFDGVLRQEYMGSVRGGGGEVSYSFGGGYTRVADWIPGGEISRESSPSVYGGTRYARGIIAVDLSGRYYRSALGNPNNPLLRTSGLVSFTRPTFFEQTFTNNTYGAQLTVLPSSWWRNQLRLGVDRVNLDGVQRQRRLTTPEDTLFQVSNSHLGKISLFYNTSVSGRLNATISGSLAAGFDHNDSDQSSFFTFQALNTEGAIQTTPPGSFSETRSTIENTGYFAQGEANWREVVYVTAGLRADENSTFGADLGTPVSPRAGLSVVQQLGSTTLKWRAAYGRAIKAAPPQLAAGYVTPTEIALANPLLAPERQRGWEGGFDLVGREGALSVTGYTQTADDLIAPTFLAATPVQTIQFINVGQVENRGIEIDGTTDLGPLHLQAQYSYAHSRLKRLQPGGSTLVEVGDRPLGVPTHTAGATLTLAPRKGTLLIGGVTYVGSFRQIDFIALLRCFGGTGACEPTFRGYVVDYPGFAKVNAAFTQHLLQGVEGFVSVDNLTNNEAYELFNTVPVRGRTTMVGLHVRY